MTRRTIRLLCPVINFRRTPLDRVETRWKIIRRDYAAVSTAAIIVIIVNRYEIPKNMAMLTRRTRP